MTAARPMTGLRTGMRPGTSMRQPVNMNGVGLNTSMNISERPVTQQGLSGLKTAGMGPQRQVQDNSYYLQLLRSKSAEIIKEMQVLKESIEQGQKDNSAYGQLERKYESLTTEMRNLQGQLADYNLLLDRTRVHRSVEDVINEVVGLKNNNDSERHRVDDVFNQRASLEAKGRHAEAQLHEYDQKLASRLQDVDPQLRERFEQLRKDHQILTSQQLPKRQADLNFMEERVKEMESLLARDPIRSRLHRAKDQLMRLERQKQSLADELDGPQLTEAQQKEMLKAKVKADNSEASAAERRLHEAQEAIKAGRAQLAQLQTELADANDPKAKKYEELFARDKEMSELIDTFDDTKAEEQSKLTALQSSIVLLLQALSRKTAHTEDTDGMSKAKLSEIKSDLDFKQMQMDNSVTTSARLTQELERRKVELEKINTLDEKISAELTQLNERMSAMTSELVVFRDIPVLRESFTRRREDLKRSTAEANALIETKKAEAAAAKATSDELKASLSKDSIAVAIDDLEQKMRHHEQTVYVLSEYIDTKGAETMFEPIAQQCANLVSQINAETIRALKETPIFSTAQMY